MFFLPTMPFLAPAIMGAISDALRPLYQRTCSEAGRLLRWMDIRYGFGSLTGVIQPCSAVMTAHIRCIHAALSCVMCKMWNLG